jgi:protocatechuate 3,4-dioxygenase beta subunit
VLNYPGNGDAKDLRLINTTTLRGVQFTDADGIAAFDTVVPGHYAGRTNHVHGK